MTKTVRKVTKKSIYSKDITLFVILAFAVFAVVLLSKSKITALVQDKTQVNNLATPSTISPKLERVKYTLEPAENGKMLSSSNYDFQVTFPGYYDDFTVGWGFDKDFPENETTSVGGKHRLDPSDKDNFMSYDISIGFLNNQSIQDLIDKQIEGIKKSLEMAGKTEKDGQIQTQTLTTQAGKFVKVRHIDAFNFESVYYYIPYKDKYYTIYAGQSRNTRFSQVQLSEIDQVVKSFKFVD